MRTGGGPWGTYLEIVRRGWGQRLEMLILGGGGLCGDFEPSDLTKPLK